MLVSNVDTADASDLGPGFEFKAVPGTASMTEKYALPAGLPFNPRCQQRSKKNTQYQ
jgi:hypothetical protein